MARRYEDDSTGRTVLLFIGVVVFIAAAIPFGLWMDQLRAERWAKAMRDAGVNAANVPPGAK